MNWFEFYGRPAFANQTYTAIAIMLALLILGAIAAILYSRRGKVLNKPKPNQI